MKERARIAVLLAFLSAGQIACGQTSYCSHASDTNTPTVADCLQNADSPADADPTTLFPHSDTSRFWISGQSNTVFQAHPAFHARYTGANSLLPRGEYKTSLVETLYLGFQASKNTGLLVDVESAGGRGISQAFGLAGFTNLDVVRNPNLGAAPYLARVMLHQIIPLRKSMTES